MIAHSMTPHTPTAHPADSAPDNGKALRRALAGGAR